MQTVGELTRTRAGGISRRSDLAFATLLPAVLLLLQGPAAAQADLYSATVIVTGRDNMTERERGFREALPLVLTKLTADAAVADEAVRHGAVERAAELVVSFDYFDRKEGIQISDEQGTRDRSFELTVRFDADRIDAILASLDATAWIGDRPEIGFALLIDDGNSRYLLARTSDKGYGQRVAVEAEAKALALTVTLPETAPDVASDAVLDAAVPSAPVRLEGRMDVTPAGYWNTDWRLEGEGVDTHFAFAGTTFDVAIGRALRRSAKTLAKH